MAQSTWPEPERGILPDEPVPDHVEPETGIEPDEEAAAERQEEFSGGVATQGGKDVGAAPSSA